MSDQISAAIWAAYGKEGVPMRQLMDEVQAKAGSGRKAAKLVGVGEATWRRWKAGTTTPRPENFVKFGDSVRQVRVDNHPLTSDRIEIKTTDRDSDRNRTITGRQLKLDPAMLRVVEARYIAGDRAGAARAFIKAIGDPWYRSYLAAAAPAPGDHSGGGGSGGDDDDDDDETDDGEYYPEDYDETDDGEYYPEDYDDLVYDGLTADADDGDYGGSVAAIVW